MERIKTFIFKFIIFVIIMNIVVDLGFFFLRYECDRIRLRLLIQTDHQELLEACRTLLQQIENGEIPPAGSYRLKGIKIKRPEIVAQFPDQILSSSPVIVLTHPNGYVNLVMRMFPIDCGLNAFSEQFEPAYKNYNYGDIEIIPGLWYFEEDCDVQRIENIINTKKIRFRDSYYPTSLIILKVILGNNSGARTE